MKNTLRKTLSLFLAFTLLCSLGLTAAASEAMGEDLTSKGTLLNQKTQLSTNVFWSTAYSTCGRRTSSHTSPMQM